MEPNVNRDWILSALFVSLYERLAGPKKNFFCVPIDELLRAKDDLLSEGGQSLSHQEGEKGRKGMGKGKEEEKKRGRDGRGRTTCITHYF